MKIRMNSALMAGVALCAMMAGPVLALPSATTAGWLTLTKAAPVQSGAGLMVLASADGEADADEGTDNGAGDGADDGAVDDGADGDADDGVAPGDGRDDCENCRGDEDEGSDIGGPVDGEDGEALVDPMPVDEDDQTMWAGGDPDFCEACGGEVIDGEDLSGTEEEPTYVEDDFAPEVVQTTGVEVETRSETQTTARSDRGGRDICAASASGGRCGDN